MIQYFNPASKRLLTLLAAEVWWTNLFDYKRHDVMHQLIRFMEIYGCNFFISTVSCKSIQLLCKFFFYFYK